MNLSRSEVERLQQDWRMANSVIFDDAASAIWFKRVLHWYLESVRYARLNEVRWELHSITSIVHGRNGGVTRTVECMDRVVILQVTIPDGESLCKPGSYAGAAYSDHVLDGDRCSNRFLEMAPLTREK